MNDLTTEDLTPEDQDVTPSYATARENKEFQDAQASLLATPDPEPVQAAPQPEEKPVKERMSDALKAGLVPFTEAEQEEKIEKVTSVASNIRELAAQPVYGVLNIPGVMRQAARDASETVLRLMIPDDEAVDFILNSGGTHLPTGEKIPEVMDPLAFMHTDAFLPEPQTPTGEFARTATEFMTVFAPIMAATGGLGSTINPLTLEGAALSARAMGVGALADLAIIDKTTGNLADFLDKSDAPIVGPMINWLQSDPEDDIATAKFKGALANLPLGPAADYLFGALRLVRGFVKTKGLLGGKKAKITASALDDEIGMDPEVLRLSDDEFGAAARAEPVRGDVVPEDVVSDFALTREQLDDQIARKRLSDDDDLVRLFGEEGAARYKRLSRQENNVDNSIADQAADEKAAMEETLTGKERNELFGIGDSGLQVEDLSEIKSARDFVSLSETESELAESLKNSITDLPGRGYRPGDQLTLKQTVAMAKLDEASRVIESKGLDSADVTALTLKRVAGEFGDPEDAKFMLDRFLEPELPSAPRARLPSEASSVATGHIVATETGRFRVRRVSPGQKLKDATAAAEAKFGPGELSPDARVAMKDRAALESLEVDTNWDHLDSKESVKDFIEDTTQVFAAEINAARRGVRSHEETEAAAELLGLSTGDILRRNRGANVNAEEVVAFRKIHAAAADQLEKTVRAAASPNRTPADLYKMRKMLTIFNAINEEFMGARAEAGRALNAFGIKIGSNLEAAIHMQAVLDATGGGAINDRLAKRMVSLFDKKVSPGQLSRFAEKGMLARIHSAIRELYVMNLLWHPATHVVNLATSPLVAAQAIMERGVARKIGWFVGREGADDVSPGEWLAMYDGFMAGNREVFRQVDMAMREADSPRKKLGAIVTGIEKTREDLAIPVTSKLDETNAANSVRAYGMDPSNSAARAVDAFGVLVRSPGRALGIEDDFSKSILFQTELHAQAHRKAVSMGGTVKEIAENKRAFLDDPPEHMRLAALDQSLYGTFTTPLARKGERGVQFEIAKSVDQLRRIPVFGFYALPFVRTPTNILRYNYERTPFALFVGQWRDDIAAGGARAEIALARLAVGSIIMAVGGDLAWNGFITGPGPSNREMRETLQRNNWQATSIIVGGKKLSYNRFDAGPQASIAMGAAFADFIATKQIDEQDSVEVETLVAMMVAVNASLGMSKSYLQGMSKIFSMIQSSDRGEFSESFGDQFDEAVATLIPGSVLLKAVAATKDRTVPDVNSMKDAFFVRLGALSERLPDKHDLFGHDITREVVTWNPITDLFAPVRVKTGPEGGPIQQAMAEHGITKRRLTKTTDFEGVSSMNFRDHPRVFEKYVILSGNGAKADTSLGMLGAEDLLNKIVTGEAGDLSKEWDDATPAGKQDIVRNWIDRYRALARQMILTDEELGKDPDIEAFRAAYKEDLRETIMEKVPVSQQQDVSKALDNFLPKIGGTGGPQL